MALTYVVGDFNYTVPEGYTGVLRAFGYQPLLLANPPEQDLISGAAGLWVLSTLLVDNIIVPDFELMALGQTVPYFELSTFAIASENSVFTLRLHLADDWFNANSSLGEAVHDTGIMCQLYGQNLLSRGLPKNFEIATQNITGR